MGTLVSNRKLLDFSKIPLFNLALMKFREKGALQLLKSVGSIFTKHNACGRFGICMAHRHFDMTENEILVESLNSDKSVSVLSPWKIVSDDYAIPEDVLVLPTYGLENPEGKYLLPQTWVMSASGEPVPFEYFAATKADEISPPSAEFVQELYAALTELGIERLVGLRSIEHRVSPKSWEITPLKIRANVVFHDDMTPKELGEESLVKVMWTFNKEDVVQEGSELCFHCTHCLNL